MNACPHCGTHRKDYLAPLDYPRAARHAAWLAQFGFSPEAGETDKDRMPGRAYGFFEGTQYQDEYDGQSNPHARIYLTLLGRMNRAAWGDHLAECCPELDAPEPETPLPDWLESAAGRARRYLLDALAPGECDAKALYETAALAGIGACDGRGINWTIWRAGKGLGIRKRRVSVGFAGKGGRWAWSLPEARP